MTPSTCPTLDQLRQLSHYQLEGEELEQLAQHLEQCPKCSSYFDTTKTDHRSADTGDRDGGPDTADEIETPKTIGAFRVLKKLGRGGMGDVFFAWDPVVKRYCVIKTIKADRADKSDSVPRFFREIQAQAAVADKSDYIMPVLSADTDKATGTPYMAMPYFAGETLEEHFARTGVLPVEEILRIAREFLLGLAAAHKAGMIHRDIKPGNIYLEAREDAPSAPRVRIIDFGLVKPLPADEVAALRNTLGITREGIAVGTPGYMPPEQLSADAVDVRADLFAFGCTLYRLATGKLPFGGKDVKKWMSAVLGPTAPVPPIDLNAKVPKGVSDLILSLLEKDVEKRPASAEEVLKRLAPIHAPRTPTADFGMESNEVMKELAKIEKERNQGEYDVWLEEDVKTAIARQRERARTAQERVLDTQLQAKSDPKKKRSPASALAAACVVLLAIACFAVVAVSLGVYFWPQGDGGNRVVKDALAGEGTREKDNNKDQSDEPRPSKEGQDGKKLNKADVQEIEILISKRINDVGKVLIRTLHSEGQTGASKVRSMKVSDDGKSVTVELTVEWEERIGVPQKGVVEWKKRETDFTLKVNKNDLASLEIGHNKSEFPIDAAQVRLARSRLREALGMRPKGTTLPNLIVALQTDSDATVREDSAAAIGDFGVKAEQAVPLLVKKIQDGHEDLAVRIECAIALARIGPTPAAKAGAPTLFGVLGNKQHDIAVRERVIWSLRIHGADLRNMDGAKDVFTGVLNEPVTKQNKMLRYDCAYMLGMIWQAETPDVTLDVLTEFLKDPSIQIDEGSSKGKADGRIMAADALIKIGPTRYTARPNILNQLMVLSRDNGVYEPLRRKAIQLLNARK